MDPSVVLAGFLCSAFKLNGPLCVLLYALFVKVCSCVSDVNFDLVCQLFHSCLQQDILYSYDILYSCSIWLMSSMVFYDYLVNLGM
ncbi:unnamed protein product [Prunus brigantina]